jgi:hypothetical protein
MKRPGIELTDRDRAVLEHLRRYRLTTVKILQALFCEGSVDAVKKLLQRLQEYITSEPLYGRTVYYRLTAAGARLVGAPEEVARPIRPQALTKAFGILSFCCNGSTVRERLTRVEFVEDFKDLATVLVQSEYYLDYYLDADGDSVRLGQIVVDYGGDYQRLISKCRSIVREGLETPVFRDIVADDLFAISIVVAEVEKAKVMEEYLQTRPMKAWITVEVIPELGNVINEALSSNRKTVS